MSIINGQLSLPLNKKITKTLAKARCVGSEPTIEVFNTSGEILVNNLPVGYVDLIFTSPPYNIGSKAARQDGRRKNGEYDPKSYGGITGYADNIPEEVYQKQQIDILSACEKILKRDGVLVYNHKPRRKNGEMIHPMNWLSKVDGLVLMEEIIWDRGSTHNHSNKLFWPHTERLYVFRKSSGDYRLLNTDALKFRSDIWRVPLTSRPVDGHAAPFPLPLANAVIKAFTSINDVVVDPYSGSGTTAVASLINRVNFIGSEIDADYHAKSLKRIEATKSRIAKGKINLTAMQEVA